MKTSELIKILQNNMQVEGDVEIHVHDISAPGELTTDIILDIDEAEKWVLY